MTDRGQLSASFRDPSGFVYNIEGKIYRQINQIYAQDYEMLMNSGLYDNLISSNLIIRHDEVSDPN